ncbi:unnamed protein product [Mytilus edulis]|uniref:Ig-like domain-containing protein n=1 Tax=Mytilus edulis TaxID=6550 RepID=A0A8S3VCM1_MYTED|nr:unnamed protein product [Mytilus edulis]
MTFVVGGIAGGTVGLAADIVNAPWRVADRPRVSIKIEGSSNVIEGNAIVLYCSIESNPKEVNISWYKRMPVFTAENKQDFYGILNSSIDITVNVFSNPKYSEMVIQNKNGVPKIPLNVSAKYYRGQYYCPMDESPYDEIEVYEMEEVSADMQNSSSSNVINIPVTDSTYSESSSTHSSESLAVVSSSSETGTHTTDPKDIYNGSYQKLVGNTSQQMQVSLSYESLERETRL